MIEAVNSAIANSSLVRNVAEQAASARAPVAQAAPAPESGGNQTIILAPYISPFVYVDNQFNKAVLQIRDSETGEVQKQFPSEETLRTRAAVREVLDGAQQSEQPSQQARTPSDQGTLQGATLFAASQIGSEASAPQISVPSAAPTQAPSVNVAQAQIASAALSAASQGGQAASTVVTSA